MKDLFDRRQLSRSQANTIAESQNDLGEKSKKNMAIALGGIKDAKTYEGLLQSRIDAFEKLDDLSKLIVTIFLENQDIDDAVNEINYCISNLKEAAESIKTNPYDLPRSSQKK